MTSSIDKLEQLVSWILSVPLRAWYWIKTGEIMPYEATLVYTPDSLTGEQLAVANEVQAEIDADRGAEAI